MKSQLGQVTLYGLMALWCCSLLLIYQLHSMTSSLAQIKKRAQLYLCFRNLHSQQNNYIFHMASINSAIRTLNLLSLAPPLTAGAQEAKTTLMKLQWGLHLAYLKKIFTNHRCEWWQKVSYVKNLPYLDQNLIFLQRDMEQLLILRATKWKNIVNSKGDYGIKIQYSLDDIFQTTAAEDFSEHLTVELLR